MTPEPSRLTVSRDAPDDEGERQLYVSLDGERLGTLRYRSRISREIAPGSHRLRVHNTFWWKTVHFETRAGEHVRFIATNRVPSPMVGVAAALGTAPMFVRVTRVPSADEAVSAKGT